MPPRMSTSAYRSRTWSRKSPRRDARPVSFATFPSSASKSAFRNTNRAPRRSSVAPPRQNATPPAGPEPLREDLRVAPEHDREVRGEKVGVVAHEEPELHAHVDLAVQRLHLAL